MHSVISDAFAVCFMQASRVLLWGAAAVLFLSEQEEIPSEVSEHWLILQQRV